MIHQRLSDMAIISIEINLCESLNYMIDKFAKLEVIVCFFFLIPTILFFFLSWVYYIYLLF